MSAPGTVRRQILQQQIAYYRVRAPEYRHISPWGGPLETVRQALHRLGPFDHILELACGTGAWTAELAKIGQAVTALDAAPEMIEINRRQVANLRVHYAQADLFEWNLSETTAAYFSRSGCPTSRQRCWSPSSPRWCGRFGPWATCSLWISVTT